MFGGILLGLAIASIFIILHNGVSPYDSDELKARKGYILVMSYFILFPSFFGLIGWMLKLGLF